MYMGRKLVLALLVPLLVTRQHDAGACDVSYEFGNASHTANLTELSATLTWWQITPMEKAAIYLATATSTGCNSGYFGAQFYGPFHGRSLRSSGLLFSMWDTPQ
jgi:hypothetical protein